jgi:hypothetical protein
MQNGRISGLKSIVCRSLVFSARSIYFRTYKGSKLKYSMSYRIVIFDTTKSVISNSKLPSFKRAVDWVSLSRVYLQGCK